MVTCCVMVGRVGVEPTTIGLKGRCSTTELPAHCLDYTIILALAKKSTLFGESDGEPDERVVVANTRSST